jgi:hypothetical protein
LWIWMCLRRSCFWGICSWAHLLGTTAAISCLLGGLTHGQQWENHLWRLTQLRIQIYSLSMELEFIYFLCKRLESQSKIPLAGLGCV